MLDGAGQVELRCCAMRRLWLSVFLFTACDAKAPPRQNPPPATPEEACIGASLIGELGSTTTVERGVRSIVADGHRLYVHREAADGFVEIVEIDPETGAEQVFRSSSTDQLLLDARGGAALILSRPAGEEMGELIGSEEGVDRELGQVRDTGTRMNDVAAPIARSIEPGFASWLDRANDRVLAMIDGEVVVLSDGFSGNERPDVEGGIVTWAAESTSGSDVVRIADGEVEVFRGFHPQSYTPVVRGEDVVFVSATAITVWKPTGEIEELHDGACGPPASDGGLVLFACDDFVDHPGFPGFGRNLFVYDGTTTREIAAGGLITSVRVAGGRAAWISYDEHRAGCGSAGAGAAGRIMLLDLLDPDARPRKVADIGAPCWCCGSSLVAGQIALSDNVIAWNYALPPGGEAHQGTTTSATVAYSALTRAECE